MNISLVFFFFLCCLLCTYCWKSIWVQAR